MLPASAQSGSVSEVFLFLLILFPPPKSSSVVVVHAFVVLVASHCPL